MTFFKYYNMNFKPIYTLLLSSLLFVSTISCSKEIAPSEATLSYQLIADKTWYLEYAQTTNGTNTNTKSYVGQSTYFINYLKNLTTLDSDGLAGTYSLQNINNLLQIQVIAKTPNGNSSTYQYEVVSLGAKKMVLSYSLGATKTQLFFSTQR
jgi:hypothetical protein